MTKTTHTPGPWRAYQTGGRGVFADRNGEPVTVALCDEARSIPAIEQDANARLIAAAPDLLAALIDLNAWLAAWRVTGKPELALISEAQDRADAAIAKAEAQP